MGENRAENEAFVSLVTNNSYANGALVLGYSLRRVNTTRKLALLVTNQVTDPMRYLYKSTLLYLNYLSIREIVLPLYRSRRYIASSMANLLITVQVCVR